MNRFAIIPACILISVMGAVAEEGWVKIGTDTSRTAAVATPDGFVAVRHALTSHAGSLVSEFRNPTGDLLGGPHDLGRSWEYNLEAIRLVGTRKGGLLFVHDSLYRIVSQPLRADGAPASSARTLVETSDLWSFDAVSTGNGAMIAYPDGQGFYMTYHVYALQVAADGDPVKTPQRVSVGSPGLTLLTEANLSRRPKQGYRIGWKLVGSDGFERTTRRDGAPRGEITIFSSDCPVVPAPATLDGREVMVMAEGCADLDLGFRELGEDGTWSESRPLVSTPLDEGIDCFTSSSIEVINAGDRLAALFAVEGEGSLPWTCGLWKLVEFDASGTVYGVRDLHGEFGIDTHWDISLDWDLERGRYLIGWGGLGPGGAGNYVMWLDPAP